MGNTSSLPNKIQLLFEPSFPDTEPAPVSKDPSISSRPSEEVLPKTVDFIDIKPIKNLMSTSNAIGNCLDTSFLKALASEKYPDRATSRFIADAIGDNNDICLLLNAKFYLVDCNIPKGLFIHLFTNTTAGKVWSHEVRSMIIQLSGPSEPLDSFMSSELNNDICRFLEFLFSKVSFTNLRCLMLYGIQLSCKFSSWIEDLNLKVFHMAKFSYDGDFAAREFFNHYYTLERLYVVHPDDDVLVVPPDNLKKLVIYCPESSKYVINRRKPMWYGLDISLRECHALEEM
jgi:hypothetical protein